MTVSKLDKADKAKSAILQLLRKEQPLIREVASVVGQMVSCFPGVKYAPLYYRALENDKTDALRTFALIVFAHPYCARNSCRNATPRHASSARAEKTFQTNVYFTAYCHAFFIVLFQNKKT